MDVPVVVAVISAIGAVAAALVAGRFAQRSAGMQAQAIRVAELEKRLASQKAEVYKPMIELLQSMWDSVKTNRKNDETKMLKTLSTFTSWAQVYASDEVVIAFHKMMQAAYSEPPADVMMRFIAQLSLALRRDLGAADTGVDLVDLLGMRISDIYGGDMQAKFELDEEAFLANVAWNPPWGNRYSELALRQRSH